MHIPEGEDKDKMLAGIEFIRRTGASEVQIRYSDDDKPIIWIAVALYDGRNPRKIKGIETDASESPTRAILRLCERLGDGGKCVHCQRSMGFEPDLLVRMPMDEHICWYQYDPGSKRFIKGCA